MSQQTHYIPKLNDRDLIQAFQEVFNALPEGSNSLVFQSPIGGNLDAEAVEAIKNAHGYFIQHVNLRFGTYSWQWNRGGPTDSNSPKYDPLTFNWNAQQPQSPAQVIAQIGADLQNALLKPLAGVTGDQSTTLLASHSDILRAMESVGAKVLTDSVTHRQNLERSFADREAALYARAEEQRARELARVQEEKERVDAELSTRREALEKRQLELDDRQKKLDDRNNTHVRREIRASLQELTKKRLQDFGPSKATRFQYFSVNMAAILGLFFLIGATAFFGSKIVVDPNTHTYGPEAFALSLKTGALAAAAIALGAWYLRLLNRWLQRIADDESRLQHFQLDIERASWLAETVLEWRSSSSEPFPELLASRLSAGLFQPSTSDVDDPKTPVAHLAEALVSAASSVKLKMGDQELILDRAGLKKLDK